MEGLHRLVGFGDHVYVATSRRYLTLSTVVLDGQGGALVVDPAWDEDELAAIPADLLALGLVTVAGLATHVPYDLERQLHVHRRLFRIAFGVPKHGQIPVSQRQGKFVH